MEKLEVKYRSWYKGVAPKLIKLEVPGWAGKKCKHIDGDEPQPWFCPPFIEGATYGLELIYPFESDCYVTMDNGKINFKGDFYQEKIDQPNVNFPPFMAFSPGHFGMTSSLDIEVPSGYVLRTECHPRFYTDETHTVPCCIPAHLQTEWWPKIFFVVFKNPMPGQTIIFRKGEAYGQVLIIPRKVSYDIREMTNEEAAKRNLTDSKIQECSKNFVNNSWKDHIGHKFDDKYKVLSTVFSKKGKQGISDFLSQIDPFLKRKKKFKGRLIIK